MNSKYLILYKVIIICLPITIGFSIVRFPKRLRVKSKSNATPPSVVFSIVWSLFYLLFGFLLYTVLNSKYITPWQLGILSVLGLHLIGTFAWSFLYTSGYQKEALYDIVFVLASALTLQMMLINHYQLFVVSEASHIVKQNSHFH